jgi:hypothetical protein
MQPRTTPSSKNELVLALTAWTDRVVLAYGGSTRARKPGHRTKFVWPPHPISASFHVLASDWTGRTTVDAFGETLAVKVARTPYGVFGRCDDIWLEAKGETEEEMLVNLAHAAEPLFSRQLAISRCLERDARFQDTLRELAPLDLTKLLFCDDRDVAGEAKTEIETRASDRSFFLLLTAVLRDRRNPNRRSAQWCVLDLFEDLPSFCNSHSDELNAVSAIKELIWDAEDDYARSIYKAGVVLGGHLPYDFGGPVLLECLHAPSKIGRRSAIHGLFHVVEWVPEMHERVVSALKQQSVEDPEPLLQFFAGQMAVDIETGNQDHVLEPIFPEEL